MLIFTPSSHSQLNYPSRYPSRKAHFPFREASGIRCFWNFLCFRHISLKELAGKTPKKGLPPCSIQMDLQRGGEGYTYYINVLLLGCEYACRAMFDLLAHCSRSTTFWLFPSGYPSVSLPGNGEIVSEFFLDWKAWRMQKTFRGSFRENPLPLPGSFWDCGILQCQKNAGKHPDK